VPNERQLTAKDLRNWKLIESFLQELASVVAKATLHPTFSDQRRTLGLAPYLALFLFGLFNSVVQSMRGICAISELEKVQQTIGCKKVSLGSFSETQWVIDPDLLKQVFENLVARFDQKHPADPRLQHLQLIAQDGSLWSALPRMVWAEYGVGPKGEANGVRLHLRFNILKDCPEDALVTAGRGCETQALREMLLPGQTTVADRYYGKDYRLLGEIDRAGAYFVFRISDKAVIHWEEELPVNEADRQAGIIRHGWVHLGATEKLRTMRLRLVEVQRDGQHLLLVTNHTVENLSAELVSLVYRRRWSIELFFRWIKCILGCRHFFAESGQGVAMQIYLALIAALMLQLFTGQRPNKRVMELLQMYVLGWATAEEVVALIQKHSATPKSHKKS
jgi:hypothetical protein